MVSLAWPIVIAFVAGVAHADYDYQASVDWRTGNAKVDALIEALTPKQKVSLISGQTDEDGDEQQAGYVTPIQSLGIPAVRLADGEDGINIYENATGTPAELNVAATWSLDAAYQHGVVEGKEAKLFNMAVALYPRVNILRDVIAGSFWQSFSEDPFLNARLGVQAVKGCQDQGTMADAKQIGPSYSGSSGDTTNSIIDVQTLQEVYWVAPGALLQEAKAATLMCSYAQVNGVAACQYQPLFDTIRNDYNSSAIVMSDWVATHSTAESLIAGMDWEMPSGSYYDAIYDYVYESKNLSETYLNRALGHILDKYDEFGLLDTTTGGSSPLSADVIEEHAKISYDIAVKSGILLKNADKVLPVAKDASIAVIGPNGVLYTHGTDFAERAYGFPDRQLSPLVALESRLGRDVESAIGVDQEGSIIPSAYLRTGEGGSSGLTRTDTSGGNSTDEVVAFNSSASLPGNTTYTWQGQVYAEADGYYTISFARDIPWSQSHTNAALKSLSTTASLQVDSKSVSGQGGIVGGGPKPWSNAMATHDGWNNAKLYIELSEGWHTIKATAPAILGQPVQARLSWVTPTQRAANIQAAVSLAKKVDIPIVFGFAVSSSEGTMTLNDDVDDLITKVAAVNAKTVVVLNNAEPVVMPWLDSVSAVLEMMYPNQEGGLATADLLLGDHNPQGRLPVTYPTSVNTSMARNPGYPERVPNVTGMGAGGQANFSEGLNNGYRWYLYSNTPVLFPFGFGLSYTSFEYSEFEIYTSKEAHHSGDGHYEVSCEPDDAESKFSVSFKIKNTGDVAGVEVPQVYIGAPKDAETKYPGVKFAERALVGFANVEIKKDASTTVRIGVRKKQLSFYNVETSSWELATGERPIYVGTNAESVVFQGTVTV